MIPSVVRYVQKQIPFLVSLVGGDHPGFVTRWGVRPLSKPGRCKYHLEVHIWFEHSLRIEALVLMVPGPRREYRITRLTLGGYASETQRINVHFGGGTMRQIYRKKGVFLV